MQVTASSNDENYVFDHWTLDGSDYTDNPITVNATNSQDFLQAHFNYVGPIYLTVQAVDSQFGWPLYPDIYIDGNYAGTGYVSVPVSEGWHSVWMTDPTWNGYWMCWSYLSYYTDYYANGDYRPVYSDTLITGVYS